MSNKENDSDVRVVFAPSHSPGPWQYRPDKYDDWGVVKSKDGVIGQVRDPLKMGHECLCEHREAKTDPWEANARLVAASPDLFGALQDILEHIENEHGDPAQDVLDRIGGVARRELRKVAVCEMLTK